MPCEPTARPASGPRKIYWNEIAWVLLAFLLIGAAAGWVGWKRALALHPEMAVASSGAVQWKDPVPEAFFHYDLGRYCLHLPWKDLRAGHSYMNGQKIYSLRGNSHGITLVIPPMADRYNPAHSHRGASPAEPPTPATTVAGTRVARDEDSLQVLERCLAPGIHWDLMRRPLLVPTGTVFIKQITTPAFSGFYMQVQGRSGREDYFQLFDSTHWHSLVIGYHHDSPPPDRILAAILSSIRFDAHPPDP